MTAPLIGITARRLTAGRVGGWFAPSHGELGDYVDAVARSGAHPVLLPARAGTSVDEAYALLERLDGIVLTGGPDIEPTRYADAAHPTVYGVDDVVDEFELLLARAVIDLDFPTLAICRGLQVLTVALGGTLHQHIPDLDAVAPEAHGVPGPTGHPVIHAVVVDAGTALADVVGTEVNGSSHHHQAVDCLGDAMRVVAHAPDGIVEAALVDGCDRLLAVQWHPEETAATDPVNQALFGRLSAWAQGSAR